MRKRVVSGLLAGAAGLLALPGVTFAQSQAYTNAPVSVFAGPAGDYPVVAQLPGGQPVAVMGCVSGYSWCDVELPNLRGWVYAGSLNYPYQGSNVPLLSYGTAIGLPIVTFSIGAYWGSHYRDRSWYNNESRWEHHAPPPPGRGGPPPGHGGPPPGHGGPPPGHGGPPPGHGGPPPGQHGGPPQQQHGGPPQQHGDETGRGQPHPPQGGGQHQGPPAGHGGGEQHGGGGGGHDEHQQHN